MRLSRRTVLRGGAALAAGWFTPGAWWSPLAGLPAGAARSDTGWLTRSSYPPLVGSSFRVSPAGSVATLKLVQIGELEGVTAGARKGAAPQQERFSLLFDGDSSRFGQGTYPFEHPALGRADLFVVPVGPSGGGQWYEIVVNRLR